MIRVVLRQAQDKRVAGWCLKLETGNSKLAVLTALKKQLRKKYLDLMIFRAAKPRFMQARSDCIPDERSEIRNPVVERTAQIQSAQRQKTKSRDTR
jgi:hypothetical protein